MRILVTGGNGQLGSELKAISPAFPGHEFVFTDLPETDITDPAVVEKILGTFNPEVVINCAAYTAVDKAEQEPEQAMLVNATAVGNLSVAVLNRNIHLVHISTDYIFDGMNHKPYLESDQPNPLSSYARSKNAGELMILNSGCSATIIRTSWLYSSSGTNFVRTILKAAKEKGVLNVIYDQVGTPTYAGDLALVIAENLEKFAAKKGVDILNYTNEGVSSWYDFACAIVEIAGIKCRINPILTREYPAPAARPHYSVLDKAKIKTSMGITIPHWRESLSRCIFKINPKNQ